MQFNWRRELLVLTTLAMEACWVYAWLRFLLTFSDLSQPHLSLVTVFGISLVATYSARALTGPAQSLRRNQVILGALIAVSVLLAIRADFYPGTPLRNLSWLPGFVKAVGEGGYREILTLVALVGLWWRGLHHARGTFTLEATGFRFRLGVIAFVWLFLAAIIMPLAYFTQVLFVFFAVALLALALARVEEVSLETAGQPAPFNRFWLGVVVAATLTSLAVAGTAASIFSVPLIRRVLSWFDPLFHVLDLVLFVVMVAIARILEPLIIFLVETLRELFRMWQAESLIPALPTPATGEMLKGTSPLEPFLLSYLEPLRWVLLGVLGAVVLVLLVRGLREQRRRLSDAVPELRESVWSADAFRQDLMAWLDRARQRLGELMNLRSRLRRAYTTATIRQIYASLLNWAAEQGYPRPLPDTPYEYLLVLYEALPGSQVEVREITEAYVRAHYAEAPTSDEDLARVRAAWERIKMTRAPRPEGQDRP